MKKMFAILFNLLFINFSYAATPTTQNLLILSDIHLDQFSTHTMDIAPSGFNKMNDLDGSTFHTLLDQMCDDILSHKTITKPSVILLLGDLVGHDETTDKVVANETEVFTQVNKLSQRLGNVPILSVFGNNDSLTADYGPFVNKETQKSVYQVAQSTGWISGFLSTGKQCGAGTYPCLATEDKTNGYYTAYLQPHLRFIALNSVIFSPKRNNGVTEEDAIKELQWLDAQLKDAQDKHDSVLIAMHIPPGYNIFDHSVFWVESDYTKFLQIVTQYQKIIIGMLAGHTHMEEMKVIKDTALHNLSSVIFIPGLSTSHGNAPAAKTLYYSSQNGSTWTLSNFDTLQFSEVNNSISLKKLYDYQHYYCSGKSNDILDCLDNVNADKMKYYYTVGNAKYTGDIKSPADIFITLP